MKEEQKYAPFLWSFLDNKNAKWIEISV
ncbi:Protein of unknown function [Bacillus cytotoxicus]|uniref:Uncharacterized protein n=1 Tax=Bacillus cytotoxicus TaxID=580165 RepID=A0AAX2CM10_9BACI|nr:Protein of unknown function [Bacillus cytotoxicus]SCN42320.1 Protein of unknown function [Bacillus cytotoxicus]